MAIGEKKQISIGIVLSYIQIAVSLVIQIVFTPLMIRLLGQSEYGLYNTVSSTIAMLSLLRLGFNSGYIRYYSIYKKNNEKDKIEKLNGLFIIIFTIIGIVGFICGLIISLNLTIVFKDGLTTGEYALARILMIILTFNLAISFPMSVFIDILVAHEEFIFMKIVGLLCTFLGPMITIPLLLMGYRSVMMVLVSFCISIFSDSILLYFVIFKMKERFVFSGFEKNLFKELFAFTFFIAVGMIVDQINQNVDKVILGRFRGTGDVAIYSVGYSLYNCYMMLSISISDHFTPQVHKIVEETKIDIIKQKKELTNIFIKVGRLQFAILMLVATGVILFGTYFIENIWAGKTFHDSYYVAVFLIVPSSIPLIQNTGIEIQRAENKHQFRSIVYFFMAVVNLIISIILCQILGPVGCVIGTAVAFLLVNGLVMNMYYHTKCNIDIVSFWKNILKMSRGLIFPVLFGLALNRYISVKNHFVFFSELIIYTIVYFLSMWLFSLERYEKRAFKEYIQWVVKK